MFDIVREMLNRGLVPPTFCSVNMAADAALLCENGIDITFADFSKYAEAVSELQRKCPDLRIGAIGIKNREEGDAALEQGAAFLLGDRLDLGLQRYYADRDVAYLPRIRSEEEADALEWSGMEYGCFDMTDYANDMAFLATVSEKHPLMRFFITSGTTKDNFVHILSQPITMAASINWLAIGGPEPLISREVDDTIYSMMGFCVDHIGINCSTPEEAEANADTFEKYFHFKKSVFPNRTIALSGDKLEFMMKPWLNTAAHIAISTSSVERAIHYLSLRGMEVFYGFTEYKGPKGLLSIMALKEEFSNFSVQLYRRPY